MAASAFENRGALQGKPMSQLHPTEEDEAFAQGNTEAGLRLRVAWVKLLRAALLPFVEGRATDEDLKSAKAALERTKEWL